MNISKTLVAFFAVISMISCKSDDDGDDVVPFVFNQTNLVGTYAVNYFLSKEVETTDVNGVDIVTTTTTTGDTFSLQVNFDSDGEYTVDGLYRLTFVKDVAGQNVEIDPEIIDVDNEVNSYSVSAGALLLTLDGDIYSVTAFNETSMTITLDDITTEANGDTTVYNEELRFTKI